MEIYVNGVKYDTYEEAKEAEEKFVAEQEKKKALADEKKQRANAIAEAETNLEKIKAEALTAYEKSIAEAKKVYNEAIKAAQDAYADSIKDAEEAKTKLIEEFIKDYGSFHQTITNTNGKTTISVSDVLDSIFNNFWI